MHKFLAANIPSLTSPLSCVGTANAVRATSFPGGFIAEADQGQVPLQTVQYAPTGRANNNARNRSEHRDAARAPSSEVFRDRSYVDRRQRRGYYDRNYGSARRDNSSALAAGFLGFVLAAAIAGSANDRAYATSRRSDRSWTANSPRRYHSFDARSSASLGFDGYPL